jgi:hypothetical protein
MTWGCGSGSGSGSGSSLSSVPGSDSGSGSGTKTPALRNFIDSPKPNQTITGKFVAFGWAVSEDGIKRVSASIDRNSWINCAYGGNRPDVNRLIPGFPQGDNAGWSCVVDTASLPEGKHQLAFEAESNKGTVRDLGSVPVVVTR